ncbi:MAG: hypothetical protein Q7J04_02805 [Microcella sp.]|nr:hypothetical protein [Microcella sp.]
MSIRIDTSPVTGTVLAPRTEPDPFPYVFTINGRASEPLRGWGQLTDLLSLVGMSRDSAFLIVDRIDGSERWAQAIGHADELVVELGLPDAPMRVSRIASVPADDAELTVMTAAHTIVSARSSELWNAADATEIMRGWLEAARLGLAGTNLRTPDDWR